MIVVSNELMNKLDKMPSLSGSYKMIDNYGNIIYIGKRQFLKKVHSYSDMVITINL